ncbi:MAG: hydroxymethylglutaryl-CoA lyase [Pseudomonadota bacterium]
MADHHARIFEVGPRDGLQNEAREITTGQKIHLINLLSQTGLSHIEAASFVSPKWVPGMADSGEVMAGINRRSGVRYTALAPNMRGYEAGRAAGADEVAVFASASEGFSQHNINCSIDESLQRFTPIVKQASQDRIPVRGYLSCVISCPYDGPTEPTAVAKVAKSLFDLGCYEISLGDTIGAGDPVTVGTMLKAVVAEIPPDKLAGHFHDTGGYALANVEASLAFGIRTFDSSVGGLGGCPYAPGAPGNVATDEVVDLLERRGFDTGIDHDRLARVEDFLREIGLTPTGQGQ